MYNNPTVTDFKGFYVRDFPYGSDPSTSILDQDIANALIEAGATINPGLFSSQQNYTLGFMYLTAHSLVVSIRSSSQGINGQFNFLQNSKAVGSVNEGFAIPQRILDNPEFSYYTKTNYGARYLMLILPGLTGQMFVVRGRTLP